MLKKGHKVQWRINQREGIVFNRLAGFTSRQAGECALQGAAKREMWMIAHLKYDGGMIALSFVFRIRGAESQFCTVSNVVWNGEQRN
jgi:hypothetical protein